MPTTTNVTTTVTRKNNNLKRKERKKKSTAMFNNKQAPISKSVQMKKKAATIKTNGTTICVSHTEYIADVTAAGSAFATTRYVINPGLNVSFPWLANMANNYESYRFKKLEYHYKPICPTTTPGKVILAIDFDASDAAPNSKLIMNAYEGAVSCSPWDMIGYKATTSNLNKFGVQRFCRAGAAPTGTDIKTYDIGNLFIGTANTPSTSTTLGELYVNYEVEFYTPQLPPSVTFASGTGESQPFGLQNGTINVGITGQASLTASYFNQLLYYIVQQQVQGTDCIFDIAVNPYITKPLRFDLSGPTGMLIGRPFDITDANFGLDYIGTYVNIFAGSTSSYNRSWVTRAVRSYTQADNIAQLSVYRFRVPFSSSATVSLKLLAATLEGYPNDNPSTMTALGSNFNAPLISNINFNWNNPGPVAFNLLTRATGVVKEHIPSEEHELFEQLQIV